MYYTCGGGSVTFHVVLFDFIGWSMSTNQKSRVTKNSDQEKSRVTKNHIDPPSC
jgi:hypothetical protein